MAKAQAVAEAPAATAEARPKKSKFVKMLVLLVLFLGVVVGGLYVYLEVFDAKSGSEAAPASGKVKEAAKEIGVMVPLEPFLVNLADTDSRRYLKVKVELEVIPEKAVKEIEKFMPKVRDAVIMILSSQTAQDISQAAGKEKLRKDILVQLQALPGGQNIKGLYFTEFVSQ